MTIDDYIQQVLNADFDELVKLRDPDVESFKGYENFGKDEFDLIYGHWYQRLNSFEPLSHEQKLALIPFEDIDERLRPVIKRLNELGLYTSGCCQGADCNTVTEFREYVNQHPNEPAYYPNGEQADWVEWPNGTHHSQYAYVSFEDPPPTDFLDLVATRSDKLRLAGWGSKVESTKMKFNKEFHTQLNYVLDRWEGKPMTNEQIMKTLKKLSPLKEGYKAPGRSLTVDYLSDNPMDVKISNINAGRSTGVNENDLYPLVLDCLENREANLDERGTFVFINTDNRIFPTRIADYLIEKEGLDYSTEWIAKKISSILHDHPKIKKESSFYYLVK